MCMRQRDFKGFCCNGEPHWSMPTYTPQGSLIVCAHVSECSFTWVDLMATMAEGSYTEAEMSTVPGVLQNRVQLRHGCRCCCLRSYGHHHLLLTLLLSEENKSCQGRLQHLSVVIPLLSIEGKVSILFETTHPLPVVAHNCLR